MHPAIIFITTFAITLGNSSVSGVRGVPVESHKQKWENSVGESLVFQITRGSFTRVTPVELK